MELDLQHVPPAMLDSLLVLTKRLTARPDRPGFCPKAPTPVAKPRGDSRGPDQSETNRREIGETNRGEPYHWSRMLVMRMVPSGSLTTVMVTQVLLIAPTKRY